MNPLFHQSLKAFVLFFLLIFSSIKAFSQNYVLYGMIGNYLVSIDPTTGDATEITQLSPVYNEKVRLAYVPYLDKIFTVVDAFTNPKLAWIDRCTGHITVVDLIDQQSPFVDIRIIESLSFNPNDGNLYASGYNQPYPPNTLSRWIMSIDPLTANATIVTPPITGTITNEADELFFFQGGAYILDGIGYSPAYMYSLNLSTGVATLVMSGVQSDPNTVHPITGVIYGASYPFPNQILQTISIINNTTTPIGQVGYPGEFGANQVLVGMTFALDNDLDGDGVTTCDCDDNDAGNFPGTMEICDGQDNDCDGLVDEGFDQDGDGYTSCGDDCDDTDASINPGAAEICDGKDNDCDGSTDEGFDQDNDGIADCLDNCVNTSNPSQTDSDCDGVGDACDQWPGCDDTADSDNDGIPDCVDLDELNNWECDNKGKKAYICHIPPGNPANAHTLCVSKNAVPAHLAHGDYIGECGQVVCSGNNLLAPPANSTANAIEPEGFYLYPNPTTNTLYLDLNNYLKQEISITICNQLGQRVLILPEQELHEPELSIDLAQRELPEGIYLLTVRTKEGQVAKQFVIGK